jgi:hypothetical protein
MRLEFTYELDAHEVADFATADARVRAAYPGCSATRHEWKGRVWWLYWDGDPDTLGGTVSTPYVVARVE